MARRCVGAADHAGPTKLPPGTSECQQNGRITRQIIFPSNRIGYCTASPLRARRRRPSPAAAPRRSPLPTLPRERPLTRTPAPRQRLRCLTNVLSNVGRCTHRRGGPLGCAASVAVSQGVGVSGWVSSSAVASGGGSARAPPAGIARRVLMSPAATLPGLWMGWGVSGGRKLHCRRCRVHRRAIRPASAGPVRARAAPSRRAQGKSMCMRAGGPAAKWGEGERRAALGRHPGARPE